MELVPIQVGTNDKKARGFFVSGLTLNMLLAAVASFKTKALNFFLIFLVASFRFQITIKTRLSMNF